MRRALFECERRQLGEDPAQSDRREEHGEAEPRQREGGGNGARRHQERGDEQGRGGPLAAAGTSERPTGRVARSARHQAQTERDDDQGREGEDHANNHYASDY